MTSFASNVKTSHLSPPSGDTRDVLGITTGSGSPLSQETRGSVESNLAELHRLGFEITDMGRHRWVLRRSGQPTTINLYGATELALFVHKRATQYASLYTTRNLTTR